MSFCHQGSEGDKTLSIPTSGKLRLPRDTYIQAGSDVFKLKVPF